MTTVGSFPATGGSPEESIRDYCRLQLELGFDVIADGEPRHDMISYLIHDIPGLGEYAGRPAVVGRIASPIDPGSCLKTRDLKHVLSALREASANRPVKIAITGPVTLGLTCAMTSSGPYSGPNDGRLYEDLGLALGSLAAHIQSMGAIVQIDEPGLSGGFMEPRRATGYVQVMASDLKPDRTILHVCGHLSPQLHRELLRLDGVETFSHAFAGNPENVRALDREALVSGQRKLGVGCARVNVLGPQEADSPDRILAALGAVRRAIGDDLLAYVHPDCGLRSTDRQSAEAVLRNLSTALHLSR